MNKTLKVAVAALIAVSLSGCLEVSQGEKVGIITKIAKQGVFCKTWEGSIVRGGFSGGSGANGQAFDFTVADEATAKQIVDAMENQQEVKIHYRAEFVSFCRSDAQSHFLTKVEVVGPKKVAEASGNTPPTADEDVIVHLLQVQAELINQLAKRK